MGFISNLDELLDILSTQNGRLMFTINLASAGAILFIGFAFYIMLWALSPQVYLGGF